MFTAPPIVHLVVIAVSTAFKKTEISITMNTMLLNDTKNGEVQLLGIIVCATAKVSGKKYNVCVPMYSHL